MERPQIILRNDTEYSSAHRTWLISLVAAAAILTIYLLSAGYLEGASWFGSSKIEAATTLLVAAVTTYAAWRCTANNKRVALGWWMMTLALLSYGFGDVLAAIGVRLTEGWFSAPMNAGYLVFYPCFVAGVLLLPGARIPRQDVIRLVFDLMIVVCAGAIVSWYLFVQPLVEQGAASQLSLSLTSAFLLGDLALMLAVLSILLRHGLSSGSSVYILLAASASCMIVTDVTYNFEIVNEWSHLAPWIGLGFVISHLLMGLAAVGQITWSESSATTIEGRPNSWRPHRARASMILAYGALLLAWITHIGLHGDGGSFLEVGAVSVVLLLVAARQNFELRENTKLISQICVARDELEMRVEQRTKELGRARDELEDRVVARTDELRRSNIQLESANSELNAFSFSVSHDLQAPLRWIDGFSQILQEDNAGQLDENGRDALDRIRAAVQHMRSLIDGLLRLSRLSRSELTLTEIDLSRMAREIFDNLAEATPHRQLKVVVPENLSAYGDVALIRVVLENLLGNAAKFTQEEEQAQIEMGQVSVGDNSQGYFVRDNGVGFDMNGADRLFGAFQRLQSADRFTGEGIGLATVKRVINRHGGKVWAEAEVDTGATFFFTLPGVSGRSEG